MPRFSMVHWVPKLLVWMFFAHVPLQLAGTDGVMHAPLQMHDRKAAVFFFIGIDCPISNSYAPEINRIISDNAKNGLDFYIVHSDAKLAAADAKKHDSDFGYTCPGLMDGQQELARRFKATVTPQVVVFDPHGALLYTGRIDNWYEDFGKQRYAATTHDLRDALDAIVAGKKVATSVTKAIGCPI